MLPTKKKQKITSLSPREFALQRTEVFYGSKIPAAFFCPVWNAADRTLQFHNFQMSAAAKRIAKEAFDNSLDNIQRGGMTFIKANFKDGALTISNDGSTPPVELNDDDQWVPTVAFSNFRSGSNFDVSEDGAKDVSTTAGMNGLGAKGLNVFAEEFSVTVNDGNKVFQQTWLENMASAKKVRVRDVNSKEAGKTEVKIAWKPDYARLNVAPADLEKLCAWYALCAGVCAPETVRVQWDGRNVGMRSPQDICKAMGCEKPFAYCHGAGYRLCVAPRGEATPTHEAEALAGAGAGLDFGFVNGTPCLYGTHAKHAHQIICSIVAQKARAKNSDAQVTPALVAKHMVTVLVCDVPNPRFESQAKEVLKTGVGDLGWRIDPTAEFTSALLRGPLVAAALDAAREKSAAEASRLTKKTVKGPTVAKHERAHELGKGKATLFVTEGDSAKNFAVAGISVVGRKHYGVYPIRGKFLNCRGMEAKAIAQNKEASELLRILGVQLGHTYTREEALKLPYRHMTILSDQDVDGSHIAGLLLNFVAVCAPSLLAVLPDFVRRFATALIRVPQGGGKPDLCFYTEEEFVKARDEGRARGKPAYYKGLGTSSSAQAKGYFKELELNTITLRRDGAACEDALDLFFNARRSNDRKDELLKGDAAPLPPIDYSQPATTHGAFVMQELLPSYARASLERAIMRLEDGLKPSGRKALFAARKLLREPLSVANAAGKFAALTHYHHRGAAMEGTLVHMAIDYAGAPNLNLFQPLGQFGSRHSHTPASAAYPKIALEPLQALLYPAADAPVLEHVVDEGTSVEPQTYVSVIPAVLCYGGKGIATGWRTEMPQFRPRDIVECCIELAKAERGDAGGLSAFEQRAAGLAPWFRGFGGTVEPDGAKGGWNVVGRYERRGKDLHVLDVPPLRETDAYKEDWLKTHSILEGPGHTDESVHLILHDFDDDAGVISKLGLSKRVSFDNAYLLSGDSLIPKLYGSARDVLLEHKAARLRLYEARLAHERRAADEAARLARAKARFIQEVVDGTIPPLSSFEDDACVSAELERRGYAKEADGEYGYLLRLPVRSFTSARVAELQKAAEAATALHEKLLATSAADVWLQELDALLQDEQVQL